MNRPAITALVCTALLGCATQPDKLASQYVSPTQYQGYDCDQIGQEMERTSRRINDLYLSLKNTADTDEAQMAVGVVLLWPALLFLEGGDSAEAGEYSRLKGEYEALESVAVAKKCAVPPAAKIARWSASAQKSAKERCNAPGLPTLVAATGSQEDYRVPCASASPVLIRCETGGCRSFE